MFKEQLYYLKEGTLSIWKMHLVETPHSQKDYISLTILYKCVNWEGC